VKALRALQQNNKRQSFGSAVVRCLFLLVILAKPESLYFLLLVFSPRQWLSSGNNIEE
jgi:hypothetical protein